MPAAKIDLQCTSPHCGFSWNRHANVALQGDDRGAFAYLRSRDAHCPACGTTSPAETAAKIIPCPWEKQEEIAHV